MTRALLKECRRLLARKWENSEQGIGDISKCIERIDAVLSALSPEPEPVAWRWRWRDEDDFWQFSCKPVDTQGGMAIVEPLFTSPEPGKGWVSALETMIEYAEEYLAHREAAYREFGGVAAQIRADIASAKAALPPPPDDREG